VLTPPLHRSPLSPEKPPPQLDPQVGGFHLSGVRRGGGLVAGGGLIPLKSNLCVLISSAGV